ncbi:acyl-CoA/acyl-ACP dehydrogenase [Saccharothrix sp. S26]|uniref:acyl-CoA dehydrogenase family protein n=1 Tax=Saccharothrix sp. S26 TaxID=2907215 RepID=UPI001F402766|nr:acyl-CoA dehydrogenase family protein [Saccharothrix sp. S26]MCE6995305.1 acyl-CoA/acyl-ACP dehydrogenase [Saccharothrix sp. S26]
MGTAHDYRTAFVAACLSEASTDAVGWLEELDRVVEETVAPHAAAVDREGRHPAEAVEGLRGVGAFGVQVARSRGGLGFGNGVAALVVERVARACASTAAILMFHYQVVHRTAAHGHPARRDDDLAGMADGSVIAASAWTEPSRTADKADVRTSLTRRGADLRVDGTKTYCTGLRSAAVVDVLVAAAEGPTFVRVDAKSAGVEVAELYSMLGLRGTGTGTLRLDDVHVNPVDVVGAAGGARDLMRANHETPLNPGLIALGVAGAAFEAAVGVRHDRPLGEVARIAIAESQLALEATYAYAAHLTADTVGSPVPGYTSASKLKAQATSAADAITRRLVAATGSRAFLSDAAHPLERHLRDAQATSLMGPANGVCLARVATAVLDS